MSVMPLRVDPAQPRHAVLARGPLERVEATELVGVDRDDELAALVVGKVALGAVLLQQLPPARAELGLQAAGAVVEAGVDDAGVVAGLVGGEPILLLEDHHAHSWSAQGDLASDGQADDAASDDADALLAHADECVRP